MPIIVENSCGGGDNSSIIKEMVGNINFSSIGSGKTLNISNRPYYKDININNIILSECYCSANGGGQSSSRNVSLRGYNPETGIITYDVSGSNYAGGLNCNFTANVYVVRIPN